MLLLAEVLVLGAAQLDAVGALLAAEVLLAVRLALELEVVAVLQRAVAVLKEYSMRNN